MGIWGTLKNVAETSWDILTQAGAKPEDTTTVATNRSSRPADIQVEESQRTRTDERARNQPVPTNRGTTTPTRENKPMAAQTTQVNIARPEAIKQLSTTQFIPEEMKKALAARDAALKGMSAEEYAARRSQMGLAQGAAESARTRMLASNLARSGVRGGAAAAAQNRAAQLAAQERAAQEQELFLKDIAAKQQALGEYEKSVGGALGAAGKQQFTGLAADLARESILSGERIAGKQAEAIERYGAMMSPNYGGGGAPVVISYNDEQGIFAPSGPGR